MMHAAQMYTRTAKVTVGPRELEAELLLKAAARLAETSAEGAERQPYQEALHYNRKLWSVFATSVTSDDNPLPTPVKQNVANLAIFVFNRSLEAERDVSSSAVAPLISINRELAAGLRG